MNLNRITWVQIVLLLGTIVLIVGAFSVGRLTAPSSESVAQGDSDDAAQSFGAEGDADSSDAADSGDETMYYCSMHPGQRSSDQDDTCPICGMDLVEMPSDAGDEDDADLPRLRISKRSMALMDVATWPAERRFVERDVRLYGRVTADERRIKSIAAWIDGRIERLHVDFTGAVVDRGEPMVEIYSPKLIGAQEELFQAIRAVERAEDGSERAQDSAAATVDSARERLRLLGLSPDQIEEIEQGGAVRETLTITAPIGGTVTQRYVSEGEYVDVGSPLYRVKDLSTVWVQLEVYELDLPWLRVGQTATFTAEAMPGETFEGEVTFIDPIIDTKRRTTRVRLEVPNPDGSLKPGMFVRGRVESTLDAAGRAIDPPHDDQPIDGDSTDADPPLVIPATAPLITGERAVVYVRMPDQDQPTFEAREVTLGPKAGAYYIIHNGLEEGDLVVKRGQFKIDSELQIRGRPSMMAPEGVDLLTEMPIEPIVPDDLAAFDVDPSDVDESMRRAIADLFDYYITLVTALADDDFEAASEAAGTLHEQIVELAGDDLPDDIREAWSPVAEGLHEALHAMYEAEDIDGLRDHVEPLSEYMAVAVRHFAGDIVGPVYRVHCPMAHDDRGADWLQRVEDVANPYFGSMMFRCGVVEETIIGDPDDPGDSEAPHDPEPVDEHEHEPDPAVESPGAFRDALGPIYDAYFDVSRALVDDDLEAFQTAVTTYGEAISALNTADLPDDGFITWLEIEEGLTRALDAAVEVDDIGAARRRFEHWSNAIIELSRTFGHPGEPPHYVAHCPMAFDDGADWLQTDETINNPYFGDQMLRCGEIVEQIPAEPAGGER